MPEIKIVTEVAGRVCALPVQTGANVGEGDDVAFVEAMKMENILKATSDGVVKKISVKKGDKVEKNQVLVSYE